ncbi:MAG TPA: NfeD family protein [Xanthobacteraceae bacterium]|nr:NfeD family protein [Xanthobacteraceae bacterium]
MLSLALSLGFWDWFILAAVLLLLEMLAPGTFMLWLGLSAFLVGLISFFVDWDWQYQLVAFAAFAIAAIPLWRRLGAHAKAPTDQPFLNRRADALIGQVFTLEKPVVGGNGTIRVGDTLWRVAGPDCPSGSRVKVAGVDGATLKVEPATS